MSDRTSRALPALALTYLGFLAIGVPEALLGASWPAMGSGVGVPVAWVAWIAVAIAACSLGAALLAEPWLARVGMARACDVAVALSVLALFGMACADRFWQLIVCAVPYGLAAGLLTVALNAFVALRYSGAHLNWMHATTALGALAGHSVLGFTIAATGSWRRAYGTVGWVQLALAVIVIAAGGLWRAAPRAMADVRYPQRAMRVDARTIVHPPVRALAWAGVPTVLVLLFAYGSVEQTTMLWASSYMVHADRMSVHTAGVYANLFFVGLVAGCVIAGLAARHVDDVPRLVAGVAVIGAALVVMLVPFPGHWRSLTAPVLLGLGCAPIDPAIVHLTPRLWGNRYTCRVIGFETAVIMLATLVTPACFALVEAPTSMRMLPSTQ
ncbi:MAG: MFS transporter, partial [Bifidobacterium sp.]|nr:MFS transporter [Bifidobacterium sp.]